MQFSFNNCRRVAKDPKIRKQNKGRNRKMRSSKPAVGPDRDSSVAPFGATLPKLTVRFEGGAVFVSLDPEIWCSTFFAVDAFQINQNSKLTKPRKELKLVRTASDQLKQTDISVISTRLLFCSHSVRKFSILGFEN